MLRRLNVEASFWHGGRKEEEESGAIVLDSLVSQTPEQTRLRGTGILDDPRYYTDESVAINQSVYQARFIRWGCVCGDTYGFKDVVVAPFS
jgi:hypothetical protein